MFEPITALKNASYRTGIADVSELPSRGMITVRGDLTAAYLRKAASAVTGAKLPEQRMITGDGVRGLAWMSPDELLVMCSYADVPAALETLNKASEGHFALVANVSDARAVFEVKGPNAREVMAKLAPVDMSPAAFASGMFRRTRMAQVPAAFWLRDEETLQIVCFRSVAQYVFDLLKVAAQPGSEVWYFSK